MENIKFIIQFILSLVLLIFVLDIVAFLLWVESGQVPPTAFYAGRLTVEVIKFFVH